jgi:hypothetical protein
MYVIPSHKFCYIANPRTGSKAVRDALLGLGAELVGGHHTTPADNPEVEIAPDWTVCAAVRNHFDTMISWWWKIERTPKAMTPLAEFLPRFCESNPNFVRDGRLWWSGEPHVNTYLRYDWLEADLNQSLVKVGLNPVDLPRVIDSQRGGRPYQVFYKKATARWVGSYFSEEIARFGYKF